MKKLFNPFTLLVVALTLFTSCSNLSKLSIAKRHYRKGYYLNFGSRSHSNPTLMVTKKPQKVKYQILQTEIGKPENNSIPDFPILINQQTDVAKKIVTLRTRPNIYPATNAFSSSNQQVLTPNIRVNNDATGISGIGDHDRNINAPFVLIVLCAIFIPPLGVGLMYGINSYFWVDLILTLIFFFPGMIFALIVVLM